jgi:hypothetical protein
MLRILVISLFVANLLLLGFRGSKPATETKPAVKRAVFEDHNIPTIHLFNELAQDEDLLSDNRQCFSLGPFHSTEDTDEVRTGLLAVSSSINERQTEALVEKGYWVFMPPYLSLLEANQELFSLQALGLEDIGVIYEGDWMNAISLGYFLRQENALSRKKGLEDRGFAPQIRVQRQAEPRYWLDYEQSPGSALIALDMHNRPNDFTQRSMPCPRQDLFEITVGAARVPVDNLAQLQTAEEQAEPQTGEGVGTEPAENVEDLSDVGLSTTPDADGEIIPSNDVETTVEDIDETVSGQVSEIEPGTINEAESGEG